MNIEQKNNKSKILEYESLVSFKEKVPDTSTTEAT